VEFERKLNCGTVTGDGWGGLMVAGQLSHCTLHLVTLLLAQ